MQTLIDSPITPFSTLEDLQAWLKTLEKMPQTREVIEETVKTKLQIYNQQSTQKENS